VDVTYRFSGFSVDPVRRLLFGPDGRPIALKPRVFDTLLFLIEHRGELLGKQTLLDAIWPNVVVEENNLNQAISTLRRVFGETRDDHRFIVTEPGRGYRFVARVEAAPVGPPASTLSDPSPVPISHEANPRGPDVARSHTRRGVLLLGSFVLLTAAALALAWLRLEPTRPVSAGGTDASLGVPVRVVPLTAYPGNELAPALSPDGESVVFSRDDESGNRDLYVARISGSGAAQLTDSPEPERFPAWSPNGTEIAFLRQVGPNAFDLIVVPAVGGHELRIRSVFLRQEIYGSPPLTWTPGGDGLVFTTRSGDDIASAHHLYRLTLATGETARLTTSDNVYDTSPALSADGRWLAFARHVDFLSHARGMLMVQPLTADTGAREPIVVPVPSTGAETLGDAVHSPSWSADGRYLTFVAGVNMLEWELGAAETRHVWAGAGHLGGVTGAGDISALAMVRDGGRARAVVASINRSFDIFALPLAPSTHEASGPPVPRWVTSAVEANPDFSPDGERVAFVSRRDGSADVWIAAANDDNAWRRTDRRARIVGWPRWSRDGNRIAFHDMLEPEGRNVYVMDSDTGVPERVAPGCCAEWSTSGEYLYVTDVGASHTLWRVRVADGQRERLFEGGFARLTADGSKLIYGKLGEHNLYARAVDGDLRSNAEETLVTDSDYASRTAAIADGVFYLGYAPPGEPATIRFYDYATREPRTVAHLPNRPFEALTVSPDGAELLYGAQSESGADLVLVEFGQPWR
jgi:Tol biopolymer transport system component/DNA-binding winged helix-turn-helix (wHTH) protein